MARVRLVHGTDTEAARLVRMGHRVTVGDAEAARCWAMPAKILPTPW